MRPAMGVLECGKAGELLMFAVTREDAVLYLFAFGPILIATTGVFLYEAWQWLRKIWPGR